MAAIDIVMIMQTEVKKRLEMLPYLYIFVEFLEHFTIPFIVGFNWVPIIVSSFLPLVVSSDIGSWRKVE